MARLSRIVLMVRSGDGFAKAVEFYSSGLGLHVVRATDEWADLRSSPSLSTVEGDSADVYGSNLPQISICLQAVTSEAQVSTGYSPLLQFQVDDMDKMIARCVQLGGHLDGPIQYPAHGKIAVLRTPGDGHMIGIYEPVR